MRFMMLMIPNIPQGPDEAWMPSPEAVATMMKYNQAMIDAGVMLTGEGLALPSKGARVTFGAGGPKAVDGPFAEAKEVIGGYWIIQAKSKAEAVEWARRCPASPGDVIEVRQIMEAGERVSG
jgi:hypothetical protein